MYNTSAIIPIKGGFIFTPPVSSTSRKNTDDKCSSRKEDVSSQSTLQCEDGCTCRNKSDGPSDIECFIGTSLALVCIVVVGFCMFKIADYLYDIFNKPTDKK